MAMREGLQREDEVTKAAMEAIVAKARILRDQGVNLDDATVAVALSLVDPKKSEIEAIITYEVGEGGAYRRPGCVAIVCHHGSPVRGITKWKIAKDTGFENALYGFYRPERTFIVDAAATYVALRNLKAFLKEWRLPQVNLQQVASLVDEETFGTLLAAQAIEVLEQPDADWGNLNIDPFFNLEYLKIVVSGQCNADVRDRLMRMPDKLRIKVMRAAIETGQLDWINELLDRKFSAEYSDGTYSGKSALFVARDSLSATRLLVARGANVNARSEAKATPLHEALDSVEVSRFLVEQGADIHAVDIQLHTPLHKALQRPPRDDRDDLERRLEVVAFLLDQGADPFVVPDNAKDYYLTPFQHVLQEGMVEQAALILRRFAIDFSQKTLEGLTLQQLCRKHPAMQTLLRAAKTEQAVKEAMNVDSAAQDGRPAKARGMSPL